MHRTRHGGGRQPGMALMLLLYQLFQVGFDRIPPVTLLTIGSQVVVFLRLLNVRWPNISEVCISTVNVWYRKDWDRLLLGAFFHTSDWHLYFNMVSFLWKGLTLERRYGSGYFMYMLVVFTALTNAVLVAMGLAGEYFLRDTNYLTQCAVGFSGVVFALKVVTTHLLPPGVQYVMGFIPVPSRVACWAELLLIHIMVPNSSFMGHLAGILVGTLYVKGPLKYLMDSLIPPNPSYTYRASTTGYYTGGATRGRQPQNTSFWSSLFSQGGSTRPQPRYQDQRGTTGTGGRGVPQHGTPGYTTYTGGMSEEEQYNRAMENSLRQSGARATPSAPPDLAQPPDYPPPPYPAGTTPPSPYPAGTNIPPPYPAGTDPPSPYPAGTTIPPPYPPATGRLYPDLSEEQSPAQQNEHNEEIRRRRLARFQNR